MMGKRLSFLEPYIGVGYQMTKGKIEIPISYETYTLTITSTGRANAVTAFAGLSLNLLLLQIVLEGNYSSAGVPGVGAKVGLRF
jgi:hypothetical protein